MLQHFKAVDSEIDDQSSLNLEICCMFDTLQMQYILIHLPLESTEQNLLCGLLM